MTVYIISSSWDVQSPPTYSALLATKNSSQEMVTYLKSSMDITGYSTLADYVIANSSALEAEILASGTVSADLTAIYRLDDRQLRWLDSAGNVIARLEVGLNEEMLIRCDDNVNLTTTTGTFFFDGGDIILLNGGDVVSNTGLFSALQGQFAGAGITLQDDGSAVATVTAERVRTPLIKDAFADLVIDHQSVTLGDSLLVEGPTTLDPQTTAQDALTIDMPTSTSKDAIRASYAATLYGLWRAQATNNFFQLNSVNLGNNNPGPYVGAGANTSAGAAGGAPGCLLLRESDNSNWRYIWTDQSGVLRIHSAAPTGNTGSATVNAETAGTIVGTQTSSRETKDIEGEFADNAEALRAILNTPLYRFRYKNGAYGGEQFTGIVAEESPQFAMDNGKSFNPVSAFGYTVAAIKELERQNQELRSRLDTLEKRLEKYDD